MKIQDPWTAHRYTMLWLVGTYLPELAHKLTRNPHDPLLLAAHDEAVSARFALVSYLDWTGDVRHDALHNLLPGVTVKWKRWLRLSQEVPHTAAQWAYLIDNGHVEIHESGKLIRASKAEREYRRALYHVKRELSREFSKVYPRRRAGEYVRVPVQAFAEGVLYSPGDTFEDAYERWARARTVALSVAPPYASPVRRPR